MGFATIETRITTEPIRIATTTELLVEKLAATWPGNPAEAATQIVTSLIATSPTGIRDESLWREVVSGGQIVSSLVVAQASDRATVAISVAYDTPTVGARIEPIGLRLDMARTGNTKRWTVIDIGYL